jgi:iron(II)-dependent oxidoreductase
MPMTKGHQEARKAEIRRALEQAREKTLRLLDFVPDAHLTVRVHDFYSPIGWHFGHIGMTEEYWVLTRTLDRACLDDRLTFLFANIPDNPKDNRVYLPARDEIQRYLARTRCRTLEALDEADLAGSHPYLADGYAWEFAFQHECQHQETIAELLQLLQQYRALPSAVAGRDANRSPQAPLASFASSPCSRLAESPIDGSFIGPEREDVVSLPGGRFRMGSDDRHGYDNEKEAHWVEVAPFALDRTPVTVGAWIRFLQADGYRRRELWTGAGWEWRRHEGAERPEYWQPLASETGYGYFSPPGLRPLQGNEPVCGISWYEADAYARWAGKRLPTETEWEFAAAYDPATGESRRYPWGMEPPCPALACFGLNQWAPSPVGSYPDGASALGILDMAGSVWEWTATPFLPYPGFQAFPYEGYSKDHMDGNHFVCRGGSWASAGCILRCSFRNWYVPTYRQGFLGLRCAR